MPKLLNFAVCDRVLIEDAGQASLIRIIHAVTATLKDHGKKIPKNAVEPREWAIFTLWKQAAEDRDRLFVQHIQLLWPDKSEFQKMEIEFRFQPDKDQQNRFQIKGFPLGQEGDVTVNMWLEADSKRVGEIYTWTVRVKHEIAKA